MVSKAKIGVGSRIWWKGEAWSIAGLFAGAVELVADRGRTVRVDSASLVGTADYQVLQEFTGVPSASEEHASALPTGRRKYRRPVRRQFQNEISKPSRPGDVVLIDSAPLGFYAVDPLTFRWVPVQLSVAVDLYSCSLLACRFTPSSSKPLDAALLLYDVVLPRAGSTGVLSSARLPYAGVPQWVSVELERDKDFQRNFSRLPFFRSHSIREDHARVTLSERFNEACLCLDTGVQLARPHSPRSGGLARRLFKTVREEFVENLSGYKGADLLSRREDAENETFHFLDEVGNSFTEWVMSDWQQRDPEG